MKMKINKKAQHEIVGFVLIVVIVSVIGLIFLGFSINRGEVNRQESIEISNLLEASMYSTTNCAVSFIPQYKEMKGLIKSCYNNEKCLNEKMACEVLGEDMKDLIDIGLDVSDEKVNKGYELKIYYKDTELEVADDEILSFNDGVFVNCSSNVGASHSIPMASGIVSSGIINIELEVCRG